LNQIAADLGIPPRVTLSGTWYKSAMSFLKSIVTPSNSIREPRNSRFRRRSKARRGTPPSTACEIRRGDINRDASLIGKASGEFLWPTRGDDDSSMIEPSRTRPLLWASASSGSPPFGRFNGGNLSVETRTKR